MTSFHQHWFTTPPSNSKPNPAYKQARIIATQKLFFLIKGRFGWEFEGFAVYQCQWKFDTLLFIHIYIMKISLRVSTESTKTLRSWDTGKGVKIKILRKVALGMVFREKGSSKNANTVVASIVFHAPLENISANERKRYRLSWTQQWNQSCT